MTTGQLVPAQRPIVLGVFTLTETGVDVHGTPTWTNYLGAFEFAKRAHRSSGFWLADLLRIGERRRDWADKLSQAVDATGLSKKRLENVRAVGAIDKSRRRDDVEFALHEEVASLEPDEQTYWLEQCAVNGWDRRELRDARKHAQRKTVLNGQADTMWTVDVTVEVHVEAQDQYPAEQAAWAAVKNALSPLKNTRVTGAHAQARGT